MNGYLLDTNVVSETMKRTPNSRVTTFLVEREGLWLSTMVIHELEYGVQRLPQGHRRARLQADLSRLVAEEYEDRIIPLDRASGRWAAHSGHWRNAPAVRWNWVTPSLPVRPGRMS